MWRSVAGILPTSVLLVFVLPERVPVTEPEPEPVMELEREPVMEPVMALVQVLEQAQAPRRRNQRSQTLMRLAPLV